MRITAIIAARNEATYLPVTLQHLVDSRISLAIIDHESNDSSRDIYESFRQHIVYQTCLPYKGYFSLTDQLATKAKVISELSSDWWIHQDADEILESPRPNESLRDGIERIARDGFDAINCDEFVFTPTRQHLDYEQTDFYRSMLHYYFFEPSPMRLMRIWKNLPGIRQAGGGHKLIASFPLNVSPEAFILRHYIVLSAKHANTKYSQRCFAPEDLAKGWHRKRVINDLSSPLILPDMTDLHKMEAWDSKAFIKTFPRRAHFWQKDWEKAINRTA